MRACAVGVQERGWPDINIIIEKVAFQGITRFEDRSRLPLGSNFNVTSFSARILSQSVYNPRVRQPIPPFFFSEAACLLHRALPPM